MKMEDYMEVRFVGKVWESTVPSNIHRFLKMLMRSSGFSG